MLISIVVLGWLYTSLHTAVHCPPTSDTNQYHTHAICSEFFSVLQHLLLKSPLQPRVSSFVLVKNLYTDAII